MSAERLREAAALMRSRAEADGSRGWQVENANAGTEYFPLWMVTNDAFHNPPANEDELWLAVEIHTGTEATAQHIASWHPAVALAVADWLDEAADHLAVEDGDDDGLGHICPTALEGLECSVLDRALKVADAYLGGAS